MTVKRGWWRQGASVDAQKERQEKQGCGKGQRKFLRIAKYIIRKEIFKFNRILLLCLNVIIFSYCLEILALVINFLHKDTLYVSDDPVYFKNRASHFILNA